MRSACAPAQHMCTYPQRIHTRKACAHAVHPCTYPQWTVHPHPQHTNPQPHCIRTRSVPVDGATCMRSAYAPAEHPCTYPQRTHTRTRSAPAPAQHMCTYPQRTHTAKHAYTQCTHARIHSTPTPVAHVYTRSRFEPACAAHPHAQCTRTRTRRAPVSKCAAQLSPMHPRTRTRNAPTQRPTHSCRAATCLTVLVGVYVMSMAALEEAFVGELVHNTERTIGKPSKHRETGNFLGE